MLDDVIEFIIEFIFDIVIDESVTTTDKEATKHKIKCIVAFLFEMLLCICVWLIFEGIHTGNVMFVIPSCAFLIALVSIFVAITIKQKRNRNIIH